MAFNSLIRTALQRLTAPRILCSLPQPLVLQAVPAVSPPPSGLLGLVSRVCFSTSNVCANVRNHFPRPNERRRVNRHGWNKRMSTVAGRRILMRRILKGKHVLSH